MLLYFWLQERQNTRERQRAAARLFATNKQANYLISSIGKKDFNDRSIISRTVVCWSNGCFITAAAGPHNAPYKHSHTTNIPHVVCCSAVIAAAWEPSLPSPPRKRNRKYKQRERFYKAQPMYERILVWR